MANTAIAGLKTYTTLAKPVVDEKAKEATAHVAFLDGLRALCAVYVVMHHTFFRYYWALNDHSRFFTRLAPLFNWGHYAVDTFIVISGFCLMMPVVKSGAIKGGALTFFKRRAWRILPPYYFSLLLSLFLLCIFRTANDSPYELSSTLRPIDFFAHSFLFNDLTESWHAMINAPAWTVAVEWRIYFLFPLFVWLLHKRVSLMVLIAAGLSLVYYFLLIKFPYLHLSVRWACPHYNLLFASGMFGANAVYSKDIEKRPRPSTYLLLAVAAFCLMVLSGRFKAMLDYDFHYYILMDLLVGFISLNCICYAATLPQSALNRVLSWKPFAFAGTFAYSIYLVHYPIMQCEGQILHRFNLGDPTEFLIQFFVGVPLTVLLSYVFFWFCERPFLYRRVAVAKA